MELCVHVLVDIEQPPIFFKSDFNGQKNINSITIFGGGGIEELCCIINFILVIIKHYKAFNFNFVKKNGK